MYDILLGTCSNRDWPTLFATSVAALEKHVNQHGIKRKKARISRQHKMDVSCLSEGRQQLIQDAIQGEFTHLLMIDDDMVFPYDMLDFLIDYECVGVNAARKNPNKLMYTAFDKDGEAIISKGKTGTEEVNRCGLGVMLLDMSILKNVPAPHFEVLYNPETQHYVSEDYYFCKKLAQHGMRIRVSHDVSNAIGHIGRMVYSINSYQ